MFIIALRRAGRGGGGGHSRGRGRGHGHGHGHGHGPALLISCSFCRFALSSSQYISIHTIWLASRLPPYHACLSSALSDCFPLCSLASLYSRCPFLCT
ncbi:hypothetical protein K431DRAFT_63982 [Polychaeton citri CBS 116435]|uniref:Uncharacterized protein n=1 Tax=Polychaeton citri CBS 116435 TaxID=1314669 RepID=A0A9P4UQR7_9PEZI|nr:hypothetical protein K431DRAFT_63982 [Polychaeton citri CBS 116435]